MSSPAHDNLPLGTAAVAAVRLWLATDGRVAARLTTVDDLAAPEEQVVVADEIVEIVRRLDVWIAATAARLAR